MAVLPLSAHAYIDPSSSLLIIQGVLAFVGAVLVFIKHPIQTIKRWIKKIKNKQALVAQMGQKMRTTFGNDFAIVILTDHAFRKPKHCTDQTTDPQDCNTFRGLPANLQRVKLTTATPREMAHTLPNTNLGLLAAEF